MLIPIALATGYSSWLSTVQLVAAAGTGALLTYLVVLIVRYRRSAAPPVAVVPGGLDRTAHDERHQAVAPAELPPPPGLLVGRERQLATLSAYLGDPAGGRREPLLVVLHGPPGVGRTALAVSVAHLVARDYPDGQLLLRFDRGRDTSVNEQLGTFVWALKGPRDPDPDPTDYQSWYRERTRRRRVLVILDDAPTAERVLPLVPAGPRCLAIVTAERDLPELAERYPRRLSLVVPPLDPDHARELLGQLVGGDRVDQEPAEADRIVAAAGGYPIALSIAGAVLAARRNWMLEVTVRRMTEARTDPSVLPDVAFAGILDLAFALLTRSEQEALALLGLADTHRVEPWMLAALLRGARPGQEVPLARAGRLLDRLARARLLERQLDEGSGLPSYGLPTHTRAYAAARLAELFPRAPEEIRQELRAARERRVAQDAELSLRQAVYQRLGEGRLNEALEGAREALALCRERRASRAGATAAFDVEEAFILVALGDVLAEFGWFDAAAMYADEARDRGGDSYLVTSRAMRLRGSLRRRLHQVAQAERDLDDAYSALVRADDDRIERIQVLRELILLQALRGDPVAGRSYAEHARAWCERNGEPGRRELATVLLAHGTVEQACGDRDEAARLLATAERLTVESAQPLPRCWIRLQRALLLFDEGRYDQSREFSSTALAGFTALQHRYGAGHARLALGRAHLDQGHVRRAIPMLEECHGTFRRCGDRWIMASAATALADAYRLAGRGAEAVRLLEAAKQAFMNVDDAEGRRLAEQLLWQVVSDEAGAGGPERPRRHRPGRPGPIGTDRVTR
ncbi:AAA family ATPase [Micromonospora sp. NPDC049559]|uniref:AAA family ATPase n=1 Tax=Micromonospora sp. NPDC049559 TaxID=3155923 RepID=UPI00342354B3